ncbi:hypothetical protein [Pinisolibacter sp.]|uniref:hypothetical protein n=1 Tax=Pinisolibacter sp. TaxID=2172024 RepID=UPI002FDCC208
MSRPRSAVLLVSTLVSPLFWGAASAEDMPHQLTGELIRTEHENCKTSTGYGMRFVTLRDVDGDGRKDVVLDYAEASCGGRPEPYCDGSGCLLKVYLGSGGAYRKVFEGRVRSWKVEEHGGRPTLLVDGRPLAR